ncbi:hypothetical protein CEP53_008305 [Fusarium sp. AF-6]|nr:hypothetical protein CEP53_008305 [Fusarium sp. AF-6]
MKKRHPDNFAQGYSGGWYYRQRMDWRKKVNQNPPAQACMYGATIINQQSLNKEGKWVYKDKVSESVYKTRGHSKKTRKKNGLIEDVTYGYKDASNLAKTWDNGNDGPQYATETAEAYAFFAMMLQVMVFAMFDQY